MNCWTDEAQKHHVAVVPTNSSSMTPASPSLLLFQSVVTGSIICLMNSQKSNSNGLAFVLDLAGGCTEYSILLFVFYSVQIIGRIVYSYSAE